MSLISRIKILSGDKSKPNAIKALSLLPKFIINSLTIITNNLFKIKYNSKFLIM